MRCRGCGLPSMDDLSWWVEPEPVFGDALAGSGGMGEPVQPNLFSVGGRSETFPDALSGILTRVRATSAAVPGRCRTGGSGRAGMPVPRAAPARPPSERPRTAPSSWSPRPPNGGAPAPQPWPSLTGQQFVPRGQQFPPPGRQPPAPVVAPVSAIPTVHHVPVPGAPPANVSLIRPPAYLPQSVGIAQIRAAMQQARRTTAGRTRATAAATRRTGAGVWGVLFALLVVLFVTGAAEKIITAISHLLQGT